MNITKINVSVPSMLLVVDKIEKKIREMDDDAPYIVEIIHVHIYGSQQEYKTLFDRFAKLFYLLYILKKVDPNICIDNRIKYLTIEFNAIYLYDNCWMGGDMIAGNGMFRFLYGHPNIVDDMWSENMETLNAAQSILYFIAAIIWPWSCEYLVKVCKRTKEIDYKLGNLVIDVVNMLGTVYPNSFYMINTEYLRAFCCRKNVNKSYKIV